MLLSLCIPTNGVVEWVFPVLESIYLQEIDNDLFEIVITDNGNNQDFKDGLKNYMLKHKNIIYAETRALPFVNEIECYKRANGELIKFVNHRTLLVEGALQKLIDYAKNNINEKPITYFSNGVLNIKKCEHIYTTFDQFVKNLSYWSSWSTGMAIWKNDLEKLPEDISTFNELFPHTNILFNERKRDKYVINNTVIFDEIPQGNRPKGNYDLFGAFGIEYPWIICTLLRDGSISIDTFRYIIDKNLEFVAGLYCSYFIRKQYCSYDLSGINNIYGIFYNRWQLNRKICKYMCKQWVKKLLRRNL